MSAGLYGADIEALRLLAERIAEGGTTLDAVVGTVDGSMPDQVTWGGPDGDEFRVEWQDVHVVQLRSTADLLRDVAVKIRENADDQEQTSNSDGSGGGPGGVPGGGGGGRNPGGGGGSDDGSGGNNPLPSVGSDPTATPTNPNDPDNSWTDGGSTHRGPQSSAERSGTYDSDGNFTPSPEGEDAATASERGNIYHTLAEGETGGFAGYQEGVDGSFGSEDGFHGSGEAGVAAGAGYDLSGEVSISENGLVAEGSVGVNAGAGASASGEVGYGDHLGAEGSAEVFVGGRAEATGGLSVGPHGLGASAGVDAFVGAEAGLDGSVTAAGVTAGGSANVYAGVGFNAGADVNVGFDSVSMDLSLGAALGVGAGFDVSLEWSPADTVSAITDLGGDLLDGAGSFLSTGGGLWG